jgi:DNA-binding transcriptional LysR family regulator
VELRHLNHFVTVADEASFTKAAARLHIVQSAVSATVRKLERELGVKLLDRTTHHVSLTEAGRLLLPVARRTLAAAAESRDIVELMRDGLRGEIKLGLMQACTRTAIDAAQLVSQFIAVHPGVTVSVQVGASATHVEDLRAGRLDLALVAVPQLTPGVALHKMGHGTMQLLCATSHQLANRESVELHELVAAPFIDTPVTWGTRMATDLAFVRAGLTRTIAYEVGDMTSLVDFVSRDLGIAITPDPGDAAVGVRRIPISTHAPTFQVSLAVPDDRPLARPVQALLQIAQDLAEDRWTTVTA